MKRRFLELRYDRLQGECLRLMIAKCWLDVIGGHIQRLYVRFVRSLRPAGPAAFPGGVRAKYCVREFPLKHTGISQALRRRPPTDVRNNLFSNRSPTDGDSITMAERSEEMLATPLGCWEPARETMQRCMDIGDHPAGSQRESEWGASVARPGRRECFRLCYRLWDTTRQRRERRPVYPRIVDASARCVAGYGLLDPLKKEIS